MPRGRSTFNKRQKEQARQQKQREKVERRTQRGQEKPEGSEVAVDEMEELRRHAEEQAALNKSAESVRELQKITGL